MANRHRGDVDLKLASGTLTLRLTLGALAEIEAAFGVEGLNGLGQRLQRGNLGARDLILLIGAAARGGGKNLTDADVAAAISAGDVPACVAALAELFTLTFAEPG